MENSFYYFFSAVPQVLGGVLALFGVFAVFKVQSLKSQLVGIGQSIIRRADKYQKMSITGMTKSKEATLFDIQANIDKSDIHALHEILKTISGPQIVGYIENYINLFSFLKSLIKKTKVASIYTAVVVFIALALIPFGTFFSIYKIWLYILFLVMLIAIGGSFYLFIGILKTSLNSTK